MQHKEHTHSICVPLVVFKVLEGTPEEIKSHSEDHKACMQAACGNRKVLSVQDGTQPALP